MVKLIMMFAITFFAVLFSNTLAHALPGEQAARQRRGPPNTNIVPIIWEGKVDDDGPLVNISGNSLHDIHNKIIKTNSAFTSWHRNNSRPADISIDAVNVSSSPFHHSRVLTNIA